MDPRIRDQIIDISAHCMVTSAVALFIYLKTSNISYIFICLIGSFLVDTDHFIDYFIVFKRHFNIKKFFLGDYLESGKVYLCLHSWELILLIILAAVITKSPGLLILGISLALHLAVDNLQRRNKLFYFLSYRVYHRFDVRILLPEWEQYKLKPM